MDPDTSAPAAQPSIFRWVISFLLVGMAWGFTTPFIRRAAKTYKPIERPSVTDPNKSIVTRYVLKGMYTVWDLLRSPAYAVPLLINLTGSVWFFLLIGRAELSLTVPITNSLAFLFTVLGEWWAEKKTISPNTWIGMTLVLGGIALCVISKK
ncbi:hypothetical protein L228DRAFT_286217 [Xylona heveae TC161]|uniref:Integral membrane protein n=1 Tax=Xylona heveae (strain CBS 132557 / TC161) TaxID=1328760 RepID=A0A164ZE04_XYLHT|nr:hypothetical protein L228DRAFT_286217 [Xylona heveae TC161]KZF18983.1 hypothetical protein L228DRAFT_286217 [Xylona heveae TC161]